MAVHFTRHESAKGKQLRFPVLSEALEKAAKGDKLVILRCTGMLSPGKNRDGEVIPPKLKDGTLVKLLETYPDGCKVATEDGAIEMEFMHALGSRKLDLTEFTEFPKPKSA